METLKINRRGEIFTLSMIVLFILILGVSFLGYEGKLENRQYIGDNSTRIIYNLKSENPNCDFNEIVINKEDGVIFNTLEEAKLKGFNLSEKCN